MARVLVTGAAGFIGSRLVDALLSRGVEVVGLDRRRLREHAIADENLAAAVGNQIFAPLGPDLSTARLDDAVNGYDSVFQLAARPGVRPAWGAKLVDYAQAKVLDTHRLLDPCARSGVRWLVYASSSSVYGPVNRRSREADPTSSVPLYTPSVGTLTAPAALCQPTPRIRLAAGETADCARRQRRSLGKGPTSLLPIGQPGRVGNLTLGRSGARMEAAGGDVQIAHPQCRT
ncbi:NAD-dependent epimerase/dehydratase family protein [Micromonospora purpureochromogenes]|uniref:NAD-dependent epimerase/dehydratase family protein n=1 Tax=Micromonospora purpureochromogenes TaxID=47872 RepID=UPI0033279BBC